MTDQEFREQHQPLHVPASYEQAETIQDKVVFTLADLGEAGADQVARHLEELAGAGNPKPLIAAAHQVLSELYEQGRIAAEERNGSLIFNLHKITHANDGAVDPDLLAPRLD